MDGYQHMSQLYEVTFGLGPGVSYRVPSIGVRGFTLIAIMVVVIIIGLLAAVIVPNVIHNVETARVNKVKQDIQGLETALAMFRLDNSKYPTTEQGLAALV